MTTLVDVLARRVREVAELRGVPLSHVADRAGISRSYLWAILNGKSSATLDMVERLAAAMDVEAGALLREETAPRMPNPKTRPKKAR